MFTGIVQDLGHIQSKTPLPSGLALEIVCNFENLSLGESIAVDGTCLTVTQVNSQGFWCELSPETLALTTAKNYQLNSAVNLERALCLGDRMGGHWVTGHVDTQATLKENESFQDFWRFSFNKLPEAFCSYLISKGSIAINGVSLTLNKVLSDGFEVMLIPHTVEKTNLRFLKTGDKVNIEVDWMSKLIVQTTERFLKEKR